MMDEFFLFIGSRNNTSPIRDVFCFTKSPRFYLRINCSYNYGRNAADKTYISLVLTRSHEILEEIRHL